MKINNAILEGNSLSSTDSELEAKKGLSGLNDEPRDVTNEGKSAELESSGGSVTIDGDKAELQLSRNSASGSDQVETVALEVVEPLSAAEREAYANHLNTIHNCFVEGGKAMKAIREGRLYREDYDTWDDFCQRVYDKSETQINRVIQASDVVIEMKKITPIGVGGEENKICLPTCEGQVRELIPIKDPDKQLEVWVETVRLSEESGDKITAQLIKKVALEKGFRKNIARAKGDSSNAIGKSPNDSSTAKDVTREPLTELQDVPEPAIEVETISATEPEGERYHSSGDQGLVTAEMADGSKRCDALLVNGYVNAETGKDFLERIKENCPGPVDTQVKIQDIFLGFVSVLNNHFDEKPSKEEWVALNDLFKSVLHNLPSMTGFQSDVQANSTDPSVQSETITP